MLNDVPNTALEVPQILINPYNNPVKYLFAFYGWETIAQVS